MSEGETVAVPSELFTRLMAAIETPGDLTGDDLDHLLEDAAHYLPGRFIESIADRKNEPLEVVNSGAEDWIDDVAASYGDVRDSRSDESASAEGGDDEYVDVTYAVTLTLRPSVVPSVEHVALVLYRGTEADSQDAVYVTSPDPLTR